MRRTKVAHIYRNRQSASGPTVAATGRNSWHGTGSLRHHPRLGCSLLLLKVEHPLFQAFRQNGAADWRFHLRAARSVALAEGLAASHMLRAADREPLPASAARSVPY